MENFIFKDDKEMQQVSVGVKRKILAYSDNLMVCELHFEKGATGALHQHPHEQCTYILDGAFEFEVDGIKHIVRKGDTLFKQPDVIHGCVCVEEGSLIDIFSPKREDFLK